MSRMVKRFGASGPEPRVILASAVAFLATAPLYLMTMSRTYGFIDRGELAAVAATLGIAHPTGYPTLTMLGHAAVRCFTFLPPVLVLNAVSALWSALAVSLLLLVCSRVLRSSSTADSSDLVPCAFVGSVFVGLSTTWWSQATGFEVYSLHAVFLTLTTLAFLHYLEDLARRQGRPAVSRTGVVFSVSLGLGFTNHLSMVMLAPSFLYLFLRAAGFRGSTLFELGRLLPGFVIGLLPYAYIPLRASMHPRLNWGNPDTLGRFLDHVSGAQFHFALFFEPRVFRQQTAFFVNTLLSDTSVLGLGVAALGFTWLLRRSRRVAVWTALLFLTCAALSGLYDINDIGNYYLPAFLALGIWVAAGLAFTAERFGRTAAMALGFLLLALNLGRHSPAMNERENTLARDLAFNVLQNLPQGAVVFSNHWDYWVSGSLYSQEVEGARPDVVVLDPEGLRSETYLEQLARNHSELMAPIQTEVRAFLPWIRTLSRNPRITPVQAEAYYEAYTRMVSTLIERNAERPFFVTEWTDPRIGEGYARVPMKLTYLLTKDSGYFEQDFPEYVFRPWTNRVDPYVVKVAEIYTTSLLARARYEEEHGRPEEGKRYGTYALSFDPGFTEDEVPDFPLHIEDQIVEILRSYAALRERVDRARVRGQ